MFSNKTNTVLINKSNVLFLNQEQGLVCEQEQCLGVEQEQCLFSAQEQCLVFEPGQRLVQHQWQEQGHAFSKCLAYEQERCPGLEQEQCLVLGPEQRLALTGTGSCVWRGTMSFVEQEQHIVFSENNAIVLNKSCVYCLKNNVRFLSKDTVSSYYNLPNVYRCMYMTQ